MLDKQIFATYLLYNSIFIEQKIDLDNFSFQEQQEILNVATISYLVLDAFLKNKEHIMDTQTYIKTIVPKTLFTVSLDTLQDMIALDNNIHEYLSLEIPSFTSLGQYYYQQSQKFFPNNVASPTNSEDFFTLTMFCFEAILLLDQSGYSIDKAIELIQQQEYEVELSAILNAMRN